MQKMSTREMVYLSLLIALNIVLTRIASIRINIGGAEVVRIGFGGFPIILAGIMFGPSAGGIVGAIGDIIGYWINPMGPYMPHFTLTAALTGIIPALVLKPFKKHPFSLWQLILAIAIGQTITSIIMVPYFMQRLFKVPMIMTVPGKIKGQAFHVPIYAFMAKVIMGRLSVVVHGQGKSL
ncbi:MAG: folate family ECF transporter S component [Xylanivirga thermophila]|uniref:folate family ECF transporter S component n=1 Tax=Xylanivirga thermophila TaxID=2496273 RepID=UPI00101BA066|nr:folate family ECF transporter S component [Xylanivirga thermophila]